MMRFSLLDIGKLLAQSYCSLEVVSYLETSWNTHDRVVNAVAASQYLRPCLRLACSISALFY